MHLLQQVATASAFASIVAAAPYPMIPKRSSNVTGAAKFTVPQGPPKLQGKKIAGPIALARVYGKYARIGANAPAQVNAAASKAAGTNDGTVVASPEQYDQAYLESVTVGGQTLNLDFDTGSSDLWVFSSELPANEQTGHNIYNPANSPTSAVDTGETWSISYGDGSSASGNVYTDVVNVGGTSVTGQAVELAQTISSEFAEDTSDGLLGLAFSSINTVTPNQVQTFFANAESSLDSPLFTANLKKGEPGSYNFGYIDSTEYTGDITYTAVDNSQGFWGFTSSGYTVGTGSAVTESVPAIADTGTSLLLLPDDLVSAYYAQVSGSSNSQTDGGYIFSCTATLPDLTLQIEGYAAVVPGSYLNYAPASESGSCFGGLQSNAGIGQSIFGDIFLKSQFVVFDDAAGGPQLGFAAKPL
ncbi:Type I transmembrane sorting receptor [Imshaugia aleurites]|uniref:Type I transmembrane sorting receptor n=1 Tax=Imshaugia aleurites TaxID=172621 RepID=A0A8H3J030_9LECA|nr:Type I transmembrane sorting receptor [Imshaugia aleurites]